MVDFDVFMSLSGDDRAAVGPIVRHLRDSGLRVFLDEDGIRLFRGITPEIERALRNSKAFVAYYSTSYPERASCQLELTVAFLAGQARGDAARRILVINPEPTTGHLQPVELSDARYLPDDPGRPEMVAARIYARVRELRGTIGRPAVRKSPCYGRVPGQAGFVGRHREQWALHSALHAPDRRYSQEQAHGPVVRVIGMRGAGKTSLVAAYAWNYRAAFPGGVHWINLGRDGRDIQGRYTDELAAMARMLRLRCEEGQRGRAQAVLARYFDKMKKPALWIVDGVPADVDPSIIHDLVMPGRSPLRTILIGDGNGNSADAPAVRVGPLSQVDVGQLFGSYRWPDHQTESDAQLRMAELLNGHAGALREIVQKLSDDDGIPALETRLKEVEAGLEPADTLDAIRREVIAGLTVDERFIVMLAHLVEGRPVQAEEVADYLRHHDTRQVEGGPARAAHAALNGLRQRLLVTRTDQGWLVDPLVLLAVDRIANRRDRVRSAVPD
jgi:hypothetical protein